MDIEKQKRNRLIKLIVSEVIMVAAIVSLVAALMLIVSGYRVNDELNLEQSGLVQLASLPTGATIEIDGELISAKTNASKLLSGGEHTVKLSKKGYDTWEKQIAVTPGYLLRLKYMRLFKLEREQEVVMDYEALSFLSAAPTRTSLLYAAGDTPEWKWLSIRGEVVSETTVDVTELFGLGSTETELAAEPVSFGGRIERINWNKNGDKVLVKVSFGEQTTWALVDLRNVANSVELTKTYGMNFTDVQLANDGADRLLVLENGNVREILVSGNEMSRILLSGVTEFSAYGEDFGYVAASESGERVIGFYRNSDQSAVTVKRLTDPELSAHVAITEHFNEKYIVYTIGRQLYVYKGDAFPSDNMKSMKLVIDGQEALTGPLAVSFSGQLVMARGDNNSLMVIDAETDDYYIYTTANSMVRFLDSSLMADVVDGTLLVRDFDGTNQRQLASGVGNFDTVITANNKYLYYVAQTEQGYSLVREKL